MFSQPASLELHVPKRNIHQTSAQGLRLTYGKGRGACFVDATLKGRLYGQKQGARTSQIAVTVKLGFSQPVSLELHAP